jgi:hypothetical protein
LPELGRQRFEIVLDRSPGPSLAMIVGSTVPANVAIGACTQLVASPVTLLGGITAPSAHVQWEIPVPDRASLRGQRIYMQGAVLHTGGPLLGLASLSNGLDLLLDF